jgi:hypothetical protein
MVGIRETFVAPSGGDVRVGAGGGNTMVVKLNVVEYGPGPPGLDAFTRQKYCVMFSNGPTMRDVSVTVESSSTMPVVKFELVATCTRYVTAPLTAFHLSVSVVAALGWPFPGDTSVGAAGGWNCVVKLNAPENGLATTPILALTRQ